MPVTLPETRSSVAAENGDTAAIFSPLATVDQACEACET